ncbi:TPA: hypothetical protein I9Y23_001323 [Kluyvera ascorbata]|uniref:Uncharacterized protein n=1 Tax=Kluyvera genomosp. 2 TaxID=2774054 RepID=A0A2T2Y788_9ENTR|nr:hypothetical protein [Kluyvera genomosp. 2]PSR48395.1 hypothetical protein C8256_04505 [Kluyvera genomosp. 2]HAT3917709.1 hypothetical protein [Kluyvera ascorbata]HAT3942622.1 hypothetical protein [Kluyvera ascorbata]HAT3946986.1 hypothetical protein [Kluyvera ascorbata]
MSNKTGGRAFPCDSIVERDEVGHLHGFEVSSGGMTLRDYFAVKAMQGIISSECNYGAFSDLASDAYSIADAMLRAREES